MNIQILENGCRDAEVTILDTRLPYFYESVKKLFAHEPDEVKIILVKSEHDFSGLAGKQKDNGAVLVNDTIYILEPHLFGTVTTIDRKDFYKTLYQELIYLFYTTNKHN